MAVHCEKCGVRVSSRAALPGHYRRAHPRARALARPRAIQAEIVNVPLTRAGIVPATRALARPGPCQTKPRPADPDPDSETPPSWWEPQGDACWRREQWNRFSAEHRAELLRQRLGLSFALRTPGEADAATLWEQYHFLKALAVRLDAERGTEKDRAMFEAGLREYNSNYERVRQRKALLLR